MHLVMTVWACELSCLSASDLPTSAACRHNTSGTKCAFHKHTPGVNCRRLPSRAAHFTALCRTCTTPAQPCKRHYKPATPHTSRGTESAHRYQATTGLHINAANTSPAKSMHSEGLHNISSLIPRRLTCQGGFSKSIQAAV